MQNNSSSRTHLKRLSEQERHAARGSLFKSARQTPIGRLAARLMDLEIDIRRLRKRHQVLDHPQGDRLMASMVQSRLREQEDKAINLLQQAVDTDVGQTAEVQLRLLIAERAHQFGGPAEPLADSLRHLALDGWLQIGAEQQA